MIATGKGGLQKMLFQCVKQIGKGLKSNLLTHPIAPFCSEAWLCDDNALCRDATPNSTTRLKNIFFKDVVRKSYISFYMKGIPYV